ncbi:MAG: hypothetical protein PVJ53_11950 [Desulfobacterales bacterium]|jgi:hypothetical protein
MRKSVLIDASSAILLFKTDWMEALLASYRVMTGPSAFREMTVKNYPGARAFARWRRENRLAIENPCPSGRGSGSLAPRLDPGERECIDLYHAGKAAFVIIDDGPGAAFCRREAIPFVNALLIPRLVGAGVGRSSVTAAMGKIYAHGRYARWVLKHALSCASEELAFFLP